MHGPVHGTTQIVHATVVGRRVLARAVAAALKLDLLLSLTWTALGRGRRLLLLMGSVVLMVVVVVRGPLGARHEFSHGRSDGCGAPDGRGGLLLERGGRRR